MARNTGMESAISGARQRATRLVLAGGLALLFHLGGAVGQDSALAGKWMGLMGIKQGDGGLPRVTVVDLDIIAQSAKSLQGDLRLGPPFDCNVKSVRVGTVRGKEVFNVTDFSVSGFCRRYDGGTMSLRLESDNVLELRLETSDANPGISQAGKLDHDERNK